MPKKNPILSAFDHGKREGIQEVRNQVLTYLEEKYMDPNVVRETPLAEEILTIARELSAMMKVDHG